MLNTGKIISALEEDGSIAKRLEVYEKRDAQLDLMRLIIQGFNKNSLVEAEAGTGVGKSFAYLLPSISFAIEQDERVVISTATITLQQQLFEKDIPLVLSALNKNIKTALVKGRGNYVCRRRLADAQSEFLSGTDIIEKQTFEQVASWAKKTKTGSRSELSFAPAYQIWSRICSDSDSCMGKNCAFREDCFVMEKRREAAAAKILVVNHHLLFADLAARQNGAGYEGSVVLPPYNRVIIDEAHTIENAATAFFSKSMGKFGIIRLMRRIWRQRAGAPSGFLARIVSRMGSRKNDDEFTNLVIKIQDKTEELNQAALSLCGSESVFRLIPQRGEIILRHIITPMQSLQILLNEFVQKAAALTSSFEETYLDGDMTDETVWELRAALSQVQGIISLCGDFINYREKTNEVLWIEQRYAPGGGWASFNCAPFSIAAHLKDALFAPNATVICLSATMTVSGSFNYWDSRSGIKITQDNKGKERTVLSGIFPSPFPYSSSVLLAVPNDAPPPQDNHYQAFVDKAVLKLTEISGGSALVLFTSFDSLKKAYNAASPVLNSLGINCLKQGDDDRSRLLAAFLNDKTSVLFATDSFWEGVDAPGDTLRLVILCKLPFTLPNDPVFQARCEAIEKDGGNSFMDLSVPESVMKFRQGFGRLIRRSSDNGVVAVLDSRVLYKRYGSLFLQSLPKTKTCFDNLEVVVRKTESMLFS